MCSSDLAPNGTGGIVPQRYWPKLIEMGKRQGVPLGVRELVYIEA